MQQYRDYLFDLYGTLADVKTDESPAAFWERTAEDARLSCGGETLQTAYLSLCADEVNRLHAAHPEVPEPLIEPELLQVFSRLRSRFGGVDAQSFARLFRKHSTVFLRPMPHALETLDALRARGRRVFLLSNAQSCFTNDELVSLGLAGRFDGVYFAAGLHPLDIMKHPGEADEFKSFAEAPRFVAVGEIGLDYYYERDTREKQLEVFRSFLELALHLDRPAIIHTRDVDGSMLAYDDAYGILSDFAHAGGQFVLHSFAGSIADFERFDALGAYFGCGGMVTFKKADNIRALALRYPEDRILLETDSPYLAPVPFRGQENHPGFLPWTAHALAALRGWSMKTTAALTTSNAKRFFRIPPDDEEHK